MSEIDLKSLVSAVAHIAEKHHLEPEQVFQIAEEALAAAYKKEYGEVGMEVKAELDPETGAVHFWQLKEAVTSLEEDDHHHSPQQVILLEEAKKIDSQAKVGKSILLPLPEKTIFGRIASQTAKQVLLQRVKETQREMIYEKYEGKEGEVISGIVQRAESNTIFFDLGDSIGILPAEEKMEGENYLPGRRFQLYLLSVDKTSRGPAIFLSRAYPKLVSRLFEAEVPELLEGQLTIKSLAREAGSHCKVAVASNDPEVDPIGAMVGQRGTRILTITSELNGEKIDIIKWAEDSEEYITNALAPARVAEVKISKENKAVAFVDPDQLSLAIGRKGQNVRLAAKLTGWKIDIQSTEEAEEAEKTEKVSSPEKKEKLAASPVKKKVAKEKKKGAKKKTSKKTSKKSSKKTSKKTSKKSSKKSNVFS